MRRLLPLLFFVFVPAPSVALADGCPPSTCGTTGSAMPGSPTIFVRPFGRQGPLQAYDVVSGARRFKLPRGFLSANGRTFVSSARAKARRTTVVRYDAHTGKLERGQSLTGRWSVAGVSADGHRFALAQYRRHTMAIDVGGSRRVLRGTFEVEALSPDGRRVFLVHWRRDGYTLEQLDLAAGTLSPTRLDDPSEKMSGTAATAVATRDGRWLFTLYSKGDGHSFVHALDLVTGLAHCIDLTLTGDFITVGSTALVLSPNERNLYLASPYLGRVTTVDTATLEVSRVARFRRLSPDTIDISVGPSAAVTPNGRMLAFSGGGSLWLYDTAFGVVRRAPTSVWAIRGLGFRPNGRSVLAIRAHSAAQAFDAATGKRLR
jgi:Tol biopolymer transport system component